MNVQEISLFGSAIFGKFDNAAVDQFLDIIHATRDFDLMGRAEDAQAGA
jgi:hypothetical protein